MRWSTLLATLAVAALLAPVQGAARKPKKKKGGKGEASEWTVACPTSHLETHYLYTGYGADPDNGTTAVKAARTDAWAKAELAACDGVSELRCAAARPHIRQFREPHYDTDRGEACFTYGLGKEWLGQVEEDAAQLQTDLKRLARDVRSQAEERPLLLRPPTWSSGCVAGELGAALVGELRNHLAGAQLAAPDAPLGDALDVRIALASKASGVVLSATATVPGASAGTALEGFSFPLDVFGTAVDEAGACRFDSEIGLEAGQRVGADGLRVEPQLSSGDALFCEGDTTEITVRTSAPAQVRVFSVARDGAAYLVWPLDGGAGQVASSVSLGAQELISMADGGDERLIAVAVPEGSDAGPLADWNQWCRVDQLFGAALYPEGAAVGTATLTVRPQGARGCPARPEVGAKLEQIEAALAGAPVCGR